MGSYVGIDLHRRRSVVVVLNAAGDRVSWSRIDNSPAELARELTAAGPDAEVAMEATWGWYWAADVIAECGYRLHLAHPLGIAAYENRRVKNDIADATLLADLLRMGRLPEAWIAPPKIRELREEVRYRHKLSRLRAGLKSQVHQVLGKEGVIPEMGVIWGPLGQRWLDELDLADAYTNRIESLRDLIEMYDREIDQADARIHRHLHATIRDIERSNTSAVSATCWPQCSSPRSETSTDSRTLPGCVPGPGSPRSCASPTPTATPDTSPNKDHDWCAGQRSRPCRTATANNASPR